VLWGRGWNREAGDPNRLLAPNGRTAGFSGPTAHGLIPHCWWPDRPLPLELHPGPVHMMRRQKVKIDIDWAPDELFKGKTSSGLKR
jgi:hypothetical protein